MSNADYNNKQLVSYLLGDLSDEEAERLDELSITDDQFIERLETAETDLIDTFVRGELKGRILEQFEKCMMTTQRQRERVEFAIALNRFISEKKSKTETAAPAFWRETLYSVVSAWMSWRIIAPAAVLAFLVLFFFLRQRSLFNDRIERMRQETVATLNDKHELEQQLEREKKRFSEGTFKAEEPLRPKPSGQAAPDTALLQFRPGLSGLGDKTVLVLKSSVIKVQIRLEFESDDYPSYRVDIYSRADRRQIWSSQPLRAIAEGGGRVINLQLPANLFQATSYTLDLRAVNADDDSVEISSSPFTVIKQ